MAFPHAGPLSRHILAGLSAQIGFQGFGRIGQQRPRRHRRADLPLGHNAQITAEAQGIGFAVPVNRAKEFIPRLIEKR